MALTRFNCVYTVGAALHPISPFLIVIILLCVVFSRAILNRIINKAIRIILNCYVFKSKSNKKVGMRWAAKLK